MNDDKHGPEPVASALPGSGPGRARRWLLPLIAFLYVLPFPYFPAIHSPNEGSRLYQARALIDDGTFAVNGELQRFGPVGDLARSGNRFFPNKAPGVSILGAGVYAVARVFAHDLSNGALLYLLRLFCCSVPTLILLYFMRARLWAWTASAERPEGDGVAADLALAAYALGSLAYTYGLLYFSHQLAAVELAGAFLCLEASRESERLWLAALAGLLAGAAVLTEYTAALAALPLGLYALFTARRRLWAVLAFGVSSLPPQLLLLWYHQSAYGSAFRIGYQNNVSQTFQSWHAQGFMGVTTPTWLGLFGSFFSPSRGLLIFSPFLGLGVWGIVLMYRDLARRPPAILLGALFLLYTLFTASFLYEAWGWTVGPRHIAPLAAFLALPAAVGIAEARRRSALAGGAAVGLCALSIVLTSLATITYPHFPEVFSNAFFEVTYPLLTHGFLPQNAVGLMLSSPGVGQTFGWILYFAAWLALVVWMFLSGARGSWPWALGTVAAGLLVLSLLARGENAEKQHMLQFIQQTYRAPG